MSRKPRLIDAAFVDTILISQRCGGAVKLGYDLRVFDCPECGAPGLNTMMGTVNFTCGAELHPDGTEAEPCSDDDLQLAAFLTERTVREPGRRAAAAELYSAYENWRRERDVRPIGVKRFTAQLLHLNFVRDKTGGVWYWKGLELKASADA